MAYKNPIDQFIHEAGGTVKLAQALGVPATTVSTWRTRGGIPKWRRGAVIEYALREGAPVPAEIAGPAR